MCESVLPDRPPYTTIIPKVTSLCPPAMTPIVLFVILQNILVPISLVGASEQLPPNVINQPVNGGSTTLQQKCTEYNNADYMRQLQLSFQIGHEHQTVHIGHPLEDDCASVGVTSPPLNNIMTLTTTELATKLTLLCGQHNLAYDLSHQPMKVGPDCYMFYATEFWTINVVKKEMQNNPSIMH